MKTLIIFFAFLLFTATAFCQASNDTIVVAPGTSGMYFYHVVEKGETLQSLSQEFGLSEDQLVKLNHFNTSYKLKAYELIKIPLQKDHIVQTANANSSSQGGLTPLYHKTLKGETLFRVSKVYGDVPLSSLREWNHLNGNTIKVGQYLIIGWLKKNPVTASSSQNKSEPQKEPITKSDGDNFLREVISSERQRVTRTTDKPAKREPVSHPLLAAHTIESPNNLSTQDGQKDVAPVSHPLITENHPKPNPEKASTPSGVSTAKKGNPFEKILNKVTHKPVEDPKPTPESDPENKSKTEQPNPITTASGPESQPASIEESTPEKEESTADLLSPTTPEIADSATLKLAQESEFQELYFAQTQNEKVINHKKGAAGWFKSNVKSGSKKYYALCNDLPRGTIVKVINPINNKYVYVKVLAPIPQQKENYNLIIKLSNAAMDDLGTNQPRFWSEIVYPKVK